MKSVEMDQTQSDLEDGEIVDLCETPVQFKDAETIDRSVWSSQSFRAVLHKGRDFLASTDDDSESGEEFGSSPCKIKRVQGISGQNSTLFQSPLLSERSLKNKERRQNNIWGSVLMEQTLSGVVGSVGVQDKDFSCDRHVESYDYTKAYDDHRIISERGSESQLDNQNEVFKDIDQFESFGMDGMHKCSPHLEECSGESCASSAVTESQDALACSSGLCTAYTNVNKLKLSGKRKRKQKLLKEQKKPEVSLRDRLGARSFDRSKDRSHINVSWSDSVDEVVEELIRVLGEPESQKQIISDLTSVIGARRMLELLYITEDLEDAGGLMTMDGRRRKTPGGVFLTLAKEDGGPDSEKVKAIFRDHQKQYWKTQKALQKQGKKKLSQMAPISSDKADGTCPPAAALGPPGSGKSEGNHVLNPMLDVEEDVFSP